MKPDDGSEYWNPNEQAQDTPVLAAEPVTDSIVDPSAQPDQGPIPSPQVVNEPEGIEWEASEYLQHNNGFWWYAAFFLIALVLIGFAVFFQAWTFIPLVVVMAIAGLIHVRRPPRVLRYVLNDEGLKIDEKLRPYDEFKSFNVVRDGAFYAVLLIPIKRFLPATIVYFDEADGEDIVDAFGDRLPMENHDLDPVDKFLRFIRF